MSDLLDDRVHVGGEVPAVGVVSLLQPEQLPDVQRHAPAQRAGGEQLRGPFVVADPVDDRQPRGRHRARVFGRRLVAVGVGSGVDDDAPHPHTLAAELCRDRTPEVLGGDHLELAGAAGGGPFALAAAGKQCRNTGQGDEEDAGVVAAVS